LLTTHQWTNYFVDRSYSAMKNERHREIMTLLLTYWRIFLIPLRGECEAQSVRGKVIYNIRATVTFWGKMHRWP